MEGLICLVDKLDDEGEYVYAVEVGKDVRSLLNLVSGSGSILGPADPDGGVGGGAAGGSDKTEDTPKEEEPTEEEVPTTGETLRRSLPT